MHQHLKEYPGNARLQAFNGQRAHLDAVDGGAQRIDLFGAAGLPASLDGREVTQQVIALEPAVAHANGVALRQGITGRLAVGNREPREQGLEGLPDVARRVVEAIGNVERLKVCVPAVEDTAHQHREFLSTQQGECRVLRALQRDRPG